MVMTPLQAMLRCINDDRIHADMIFEKVAKIRVQWKYGHPRRRVRRDQNIAKRFRNACFFIYSAQFDFANLREYLLSPQKSYGFYQLHHTPDHVNPNPLSYEARPGFSESNSANLFMVVVYLNLEA
jgi:hypothetical protein